MRHITETEYNEYLAGLAGPERMADMQAHIEACPACRTRLQQVERTGQLLDQWQVDTAGRSIADNVIEAVQQPKTISFEKAARRRRRLWSAAAQIAATVLIGVSLGHLAGRNSADTYIARQQGDAAVEVRPGYLAALDLQFASDLTWSVLDTTAAEPEEQP